MVCRPMRLVVLARFRKQPKLVVFFTEADYNPESNKQ